MEDEMSQISPINHVLKDHRRVSIRCAVESDAAQNLHCREACTRDGEGLISLPDERNRSEKEHRQSIRQFLEAPCDLLLIAEHQGKIVGNLDFQSNRRRRLAHTGDFAIALLREWRGLGVGSMLLETLVKWAESNPAIEKLSLRVLYSNAPAIGLYRKFGFVEEGRCVREVRYEDGTYSDELLMARFV